MTSSRDGYLRLYSSASDGFSLVAKSDAPGGSQPFAAVFSPAGDKIAVGFQDSTNVNVLGGHDLAFLYAPDTTGINNGNLSSVAWSQDGNSLYAGDYTMMVQVFLSYIGHKQDRGTIQNGKPP